MERVSALIVDDERLARKRIRRFLCAEPGMEVIAECENGPQAAAFLQERRPDILFLDIQMPGLDGFGVVQSLNSGVRPMIIFVTAFDDYAVRAFEVHAFDYLLKPFDRKRFQETLQRAKSQLERLRGGDMGERLAALMENLREPKRAVDRIAIRSGGHVFFVRTRDIDWIEAADNYVCLHCGPDTHILRETMNALETRLDGDTFLRVHRSTIVNVDRIKELQPWFRGDYRILLQNGMELTMSRSYRDRLQNTLLKVK